MNGFNKEQGDYNICKNHSSKCERELYSICPSKLSKKELEDLYFNLLENNIELKKTIKSQQENIKLLSTKVQRMTASQRSNLMKENRDCCAATKAIVQEQKESLADLRKANDRMSERIRVLNMRLCSAKQFLKRSPSQINTRCFKCLTAPPGSMKNSSVSVLNTIRSENIPKTAAASIQCLYNEVTTRDVETNTNELNKDSSCDENKCQTVVEELKQKVVNLQEELSNTHEQYSIRTRRQQRELQRADHELAARLRDQATRCNELSTQLSIEKSKVAELEMRLKAADMSAQVAKTIESHLTNLNMELKSQSFKIDQQFGTSSPLPAPDWEVTPPKLYVSELAINQHSPDPGHIGHFKHSDDSGYTDINRSHEYEDDNMVLAKVNKELMMRISDLQGQLDLLRITAVDETKYNKASESVNIQHADVKLKNGLYSNVKGTTRKNTIEKEFTTKDDIEPTIDSAMHAEQNGEHGVTNAATGNELFNDELITSNKIEEGNLALPLKTEQFTHNDIDKESPTAIHPNKIATNIKRNSHDSLQIPGPLGNADSSISKTKPLLKEQRSVDEKLKGDSAYCLGKENEKKQSMNIIKNNEVLIDAQLLKYNSKDSGRKDVSPDESNLTVKDNDVKLNVHKLCESTGKQVEGSGFGGAVQIEPQESRCLDTQKADGQQTQQNAQRQQRLQQPARQWSPASGRTYSLGAISDTDCEISSMSDLPDEQYVGLASYREPLSPGERKPTTTSTSEYTSYSAPATDYGDLSDGELPALTVKNLSAETKLAARTEPLHPIPTSQRVDEALQAIGKELTRCKELLQTQRPQEVNWSSF